MKIKLQNFLFLLGAAYLVRWLFLLSSFVFYIFRDVVPISDKFIDFIVSSFPAIAIVLGVINFLNTKFALYIYDKAKLHFPRLQWYGMFFSWTIVAEKYIRDFDSLSAVVASCIVAALYYPNRTWKQRFYSALKFTFLLFVLYLFARMED